MKKLTQCVCIILIMAMILPMAALAVEDPLRASSYFAADSCYLHKVSSTEFEVWFDVTAVGSMDILGASKVIVQRSADGSNWTNMKTYTKEDYPQMIDYNSFIHDCGLSYTAEKGYYYRAYVKFYAKKGTGSASLDRYTSIMKL